MKKSKKIFGFLITVISIFCLLYGFSHSYFISGYGHEENMWTADESTGYFILNDCTIDLNQGEYSLSFAYQNKVNKNIVLKLLDMEHNDGNNHLGKVVTTCTLEPGVHDTAIQFELMQDTHQLKLYADEEFDMYDWRVDLVKDNYTDVIFLCLLLIVILYLLYFKFDWKKPQYTAILCALGIFITLPFAGEVLQSGHDLPFHISRIKGVAEGLSYGQFPVRLNMDINYGYGFVSEILYPNLFVYFPALLMFLGMSVLSAYKFWILFINIATALAGYYSFSRLLKSDKLGAVCAVLYLINPYRLNNIFLRASIGEVLAQIFLPLLVYALAEVIYGEHRKWWLLSVAAIGIMQSHVVSLEICIMFAVLFCLISLKNLFSGNGLKRIVSCLKAAFAVIMLNLWFLVPFLDHLKNEYYLVADKRDLSRETVYLLQMFLSHFKVAGDNVTDGLNGEMPLTIGIILLIGSGCYIYYTYGLKKIQGRLKKIGDVSLLFGGLSCYMASEYFPWKLLERNCGLVYGLLAKMQYPWRMLGYASLFLCIVTTIALSALWKDGKRIAVYGVLGGSALLMLECTDGYLSDSNTASMLTSRNQDPVSIIYLDYYYENNISDSDSWVFHEIGEQIVAEPETEISDFEKRGTDIKFHFEKRESAGNVIMRMPLYNYSLHKAYLDGKEIAIGTGSYGMIAIDIPKEISSGDIEVVYAGRKLYKLADVCSLIAILGLAGYLCTRKISSRRKGRDK